MNRSSFKRRSFSRSASTNLGNSSSAVPCGSSSIARNVFPTTLLGMAVGPPFCLAYFHTAPGKYNVGLRTPLFARRRSQRVEAHFATKARLPAPRGVSSARSFRHGVRSRIVDRHDVLERDFKKQPVFNHLFLCRRHRLINAQNDALGLFVELGDELVEGHMIPMFLLR